MPVATRKTQYQVTHEISVAIAFDTAGIAAGVVVGALPSGAVIDKTTVLTTTAFNGTVSVALSVGFTATGTELISGTDVRTAAARVDTVAPIAQAVLAADKIVYTSLTFGGTVGTAGVANVVVSYWPAIG